MTLPMTIIDQLIGLGRDARFHGNGFVQLYISQNQRLHVWAPTLPRIPGHNAAIHDHVYDMRSRVLVGTLIQCTYEIDSAPRPHDDAYFMDVHRLSPEARRDPRGEPGFVSEGLRMVRETGRLEIGEGRTYTQARDTLHDSETPFGLTVATLFERLPRGGDQRNARVLCPPGETPMNAFAPEHQPPQEALWAAIGLAVQLMPIRSLVLLGEAIEGE